MSVLTCAQVRELAPELALGVLGGAERAETIAHIKGCARCQAYVLELTEAADALALLAPEVEPPAGFESRVLSGIHADRRRDRRRWFGWVAAAAAAVAILSVTVVRVVESGDSTTAAAPTTNSAQAPVAVAMHGGAGDVAAGWAYVSSRHGVAVAVNYGIPAGEYGIQVHPVGATPVVIGTMAVDAGRGSWTGRSPPALSEGSRIALVDTSGREVCHGTVPAAE
ncbi:MAG: zf-HC2 domain-containing protein [Candidatus Eisenbacteria bacterium]